MHEQRRDRAPHESSYSDDPSEADQSGSSADFALSVRDESSSGARIDDRETLALGKACANFKGSIEPVPYRFLFVVTVCTDGGQIGCQVGKESDVKDARRLLLGLEVAMRDLCRSEDARV